MERTSKSKPVRAHLRSVIVVALTLVGVAYTAPDLALPWHAWANYGMNTALTTSTTATVTSVDAGGPAARAGVRPGDVIDMATMAPSDRRSTFTSYNAERSGVRATFRFVRGRGPKAVTLVSVPHVRTLADNATDLVQVLTLIAFPIVGMILLLARPAVLTWAFFGYALSVANGSVLAESYSPTWLQMAELLWQETLTIVGLASFIIFALRFPSNVVTGWKRLVERVVVVASIPLLLATVYEAVGDMLLAPQVATIGLIVTTVTAIGFCVGAIAFIATLVAATPQERPRVVWVIFGFLTGYAGLAIMNICVSAGLYPPIWITNSLQLLDVLIPITVTYAILKHRVIDIRFFLNRALVYGILTTIGVGLLVLLDWAVARRLESFGLIVEVAGALALGIGIQHLHGFVDAIVDRYVFRSVHDAERHLARVGDAMMYAESLGAIDKMLVEESARALRLASAAVFRRTGEQRFAREAATGWSETTATVVEADDPLALDLQAQKRGIAGGPFLADHVDFPTGACAAAFAVPVCIRERMIGFALFGAHLNASDIDPNEQSILESFVARATVAYDHVSNLERAVENARMRIELDFLRGLVRPAPPASLS